MHFYKSNVILRLISRVNTKHTIFTKKRKNNPKQNLITLNNICVNLFFLNN